MKKVICNENHFQNCCYDYRKGESMKEFGYEKQYDVIVAGGYPVLWLPSRPAVWERMS